MKPKTKFWVWRNQAESESERVLELYGTIAESSWFDDDVTPEMFRRELFSDTGPVTVWLNSPGGDCIAASQIYSMLMDYKDDVTVKIDGLAASAASVIAMAGTRVLMAPTAMMMIHNPLTAVYGNHSDMEKAIEMLDQVKESIINAYEIRTGLSRAKLSHYMDSETWMNANKAIELGFADDILTDAKRAAVEAPAYAFSSKDTERILLNKLSAHYTCGKKPATAAVASNSAAAQPATENSAPPATKPEAPTGRSVNELMERLNLLKY